MQESRLCGLGGPLLGMFHLEKAELCKLALWPQGLTSGGHLGHACRDVSSMLADWLEVAD